MNEERDPHDEPSLNAHRRVIHDSAFADVSFRAMKY
jgi:hypothetical protein